MVLSRIGLCFLVLLVSLTCQAQITSRAGADPAVAAAGTEDVKRDVPVDPAYARAHPKQRPDFNTDIYYRNKLEYPVETGFLPFNIPLVFDFLVGSPYSQYPLHYTLAPIIVALRWHIDGIGGPSLMRGNWDLTFSNSFTVIPRGPETRYIAFDSGIRRNFVQRNWRVVPYFEMRGGVGGINAKGPHRVVFAQGQDLTFTLMMGSGFRYNFSPRYSLAVGATYMHVSNAGLSDPRYEDYGINVWGPIMGFNVRLGKDKGAIRH